MLFRSQFGTLIVLITHDLGVIVGMADRVLVMYGGRIVERGTRRDFRWYCTPGSEY